MKIITLTLLLLCTQFAIANSDLNMGEKAPKVGDSLPDIRLGEKKLSEHLKEGQVLLTVYRGGWCPYCIKQLKNYQENLKRFKDNNIKIIAISPDTKKSTLKTVAKNKLSFLVVSDKDHKVLRGLNLVFKLDNDTVEKYKKYGIDLVKSQGNENYELPIPATYLINQKGKIIYAHVDVNYKDRASVSEILSSLEKK